MEASTRPKRRWRQLVLLSVAPVGCLLLVGALWLALVVVPRARAGTLDLRLGLPGAGPSVVVKVDHGGTPQAPRRLVIGVQVGARAPSF